MEEVTVLELDGMEYLEVDKIEANGKKYIYVSSLHEEGKIAILEEFVIDGEAKVKSVSKDEFNELIKVFANRMLEQIQ